MDPLPPPGKPQPTEQEKRKDQEERQLRISYNMVFQSEHGKRVLEDLKARCGWMADGVEKPSYTPGMPAEAAIYNDALKGAVRHIQHMLAPLPENPEQRPETATTA